MGFSLQVEQFCCRDHWLKHHTFDVKCGRNNTLQHGKLLVVNGRPIIQMGSQHLAPSAFEKLAGREGSRNWRLSVRVLGTWVEWDAQLKAGELQLWQSRRDDRLAKQCS